MACEINGNSIRAGIKTVIETDLLNSGLFQKEEDSFTSVTELVDAQDFVNGINSRFGSEVVKKVGNKSFELRISDDLIRDYFVASNEGTEVMKIIAAHNDFEISPKSWNDEEMFTYLNYPEVSEMTDSALKSFLKSINPNFRVEEIDDLPVEGIAQVKKFLIQVRTLSKFSAISEEVAHIFTSLLPDNHPLKVEILDNITSFPIYSLTLNQFKDKYTTERGTPDYNKIKKEAADKLISEYIYALSENDNARLQILGKPKQNFIQKWFGKFLKWLGLEMRDKTQAYADIAGIILSGRNDQTLKTAKGIEDISYTDSYFYRLSEEELFSMTSDILASEPPRLAQLITDFSKQFGRKFNEILKDERYATLNEELKKTNNSIGKINHLSEIKAMLNNADIGMKAALDTEAYVIGVKQFLEAVDRLGILSDSIIRVVNSKEKAKTFNEAIENIKELESYFQIYETFVNTISAELADELVKSGVGADTVRTILNTQANFETVNRIILDKHQNNLFIFYRDILSPTNEAVLLTLQDDLARAKSLKPSKAKDELVKSVNEKIKDLVINDEKIIKTLSGKGKDIDALSTVNHLLNASIINGDLFVAGIARHITNELEKRQQLAKVYNLKLYERIDPIQKALNETADVTGKAISFVNTILDGDTGEERKVLTWLNPHRDIDFAREKLRAAVIEASENRSNADPNSSEYKELTDKLLKARKDYDGFLEKFMNRPFVKAYYDFHKKYENNPVYIDAMAKYTYYTDQINALEEEAKIEPERDDLWESIAINRRLRANLLNEIDDTGTMKPEAELERVRILKQYFEESSQFKELDEVQTQRSYGIARNRYEQKVDFGIQAAKDSPNLRTIQAVEERLREVMRDKRLRIKTLYEMNEDLIGEPIDYNYIKELLMAKWDNKNITIQKNEKYYEDEKAIIDQINELSKKGQLTEEEELIKDAYENLRTILFGSRDGAGQVNPASLTEDQREAIIELEDTIEELRHNKPTVGVNLEDFTEEDRLKWEEYNALANDGTQKGSRRRDAILKKSRLEKKYKNSGTAKAIKELYKLLGEMSERKATQYYWDKMEQFIPLMNSYVEELQKGDYESDEKARARDAGKLFTEIIDDQEYEELEYVFLPSEFFGEFIEYTMKKNRDLFVWFAENHREKTVFDSSIEKYVKLPYVRSAIYTVKEPTKDEHKKLVVNKKYTKQKVKDEFKTGYNPTTKKVELKIGEHITNRETRNGYPEFLPLSPEQGEPSNSPYRNEEYYRLKNSTNPTDQLRFKYLEILKETNLENQSKLPARLRSWMAVPVISLTNIESIKDAPSAAKQALAKVKSVFTKSESADAEAQIEGEDTIKEIDQFTQKTINERIPKLGMSQKLDINVVSRNLLRSTAQFVIRANEFEARTEAQPVVKALLRVMNDNNFKGNTSNKERAKIFEKIYSQMILQETPEGSLNNRQVRRIAKFLTGNTALRMLGDPIGGVINYSSAMVNNIIEASAGKYMTLQQLAKGKLLAGRVNTSLMADFGKKSNLGHDTLLFNYFDFIQGDFEEDLLDRSSSLDKGSSIQQLLMIPRKAGELFAQTATAMGILEKYKVENTIDGKTYSVHEIYKKEGNTLVLKEGFPQEYNPVDGAKFLRIKQIINRVNLELHGNYAKISQTEASRYALGKLAENMKRWFMPAIQRRFGRESADITFEDLNPGYYRTSAVALRKYFTALAHLDFGGAKSVASFYLNTPRYRQNIQRMGAEVVQATILFLIFAVMLGYSGDDKNKELDDNSWIHNTAILIALRAYSETTAYIPVPPWGFQEMKRNVLAPFSLPADAISNFMAIAQLGLYQLFYWFGADSLEDQLYYKKDSGFWYSEAGDSKLFKYILKTAGHSGYTLEPAQYIKTFDNLQKRLK